MKIGLLDSGLGGLTVLYALQKLPNTEFVYIADTAYVPYGTKKKSELRERAQQLLIFLQEQEVDAIVVACHTLCAVAHDLFSTVSVPVISVIDPVVTAALKVMRQPLIGVMATPITIGLNAHKIHLKSQNPNVQIIEQACPDLVTLLEDGVTDQFTLLKKVQEYVEPFKERGVDTIILGCTHYALLTKELTAVLGSDVQLISADMVIDEFITDLFTTGLSEATQPNTITYYVTGDVERFVGNVRNVLGKVIVAQALSFPQSLHVNPRVTTLY